MDAIDFRMRFVPLVDRIRRVQVSYAAIGQIKVAIDAFLNTVQRPTTANANVVMLYDRLDLYERSVENELVLLVEDVDTYEPGISTAERALLAALRLLVESEELST